MAGAWKAQSKLFNMIELEFHKKKEKFDFSLLLKTLPRINSLQKSRVNVKCMEWRDLCLSSSSCGFRRQCHSGVGGGRIEDVSTRWFSMGWSAGGSFFTLGFFHVFLSLPPTPGRRSQWYCSLLLPPPDLKGYGFTTVLLNFLVCFLLFPLYTLSLGEPMNCDEYHNEETKPSLTWA